MFFWNETALTTHYTHCEHPFQVSNQLYANVRVHTDTHTYTHTLNSAFVGFSQPSPVPSSLLDNIHGL